MPIELALAIMALAVKAAPYIEEAIKSGDKTPEEQQRIRDAYDAYRAAFSSAFDKPEWKPSDEPVAPVGMSGLTPPV